MDQNTSCGTYTRRARSCGIGGVEHLGVRIDSVGKEVSMPNTEALRRFMNPVDKVTREISLEYHERACSLYSG